MELTDKMIQADATESAKFFLQFGIGIIVVLAIIIVVLVVLKKFDKSMLPLMIFASLIGGAGMVFGVLGYQNTSDYYVMETTVANKEYREPERQPGGKTVHSKRGNDYGTWHVYFTNDFLPDDSQASDSKAEIGDHVYIAYSERSGFVRYYYGNEYKYEGTHLKN